MNGLTLDRVLAFREDLNASRVRAHKSKGIMFDRWIAGGLLAAAAAAAIGLTGCATVIRGANVDFAIESSPSTVLARLSNGMVCVTPCKLFLPRNKAFSVTFEKEGYKAETVEVRSTFASSSTPEVAGSTILTPVLSIGGVGADVTSGALRDLSPNPLHVQLTQEQKNAGTR